MTGLANNYTRAQIANLPRKRKALNRVIDRFKTQKEKLDGMNDNDPHYGMQKVLVQQLYVEVARRMKYTMKGATPA